MLDAVAENAARLCEATDASDSTRIDGDNSDSRAHYGPLPTAAWESSPVDRGQYTAVERSSTGKRFIFMTCSTSQTIFLTSWLRPDVRYPDYPCHAVAS